MGNSLADANHEFMDGSSPLLDLLSVRNIHSVDNFVNFRVCLEAYIYQNPDMELHKSAVQLGILADDRLFIAHRTVMPYSFVESGTYFIDGKEHDICGYDDFALNMTAPFLMECGFSVSEKFNVIEIDSLITSEHTHTGWERIYFYEKLFRQSSVF